MRIGLVSFCLLTGCAADSGSPPSSPGDDTSGEAGSATALVLRGGAPAIGVSVVFSAADGSLLATVATDGDGKAAIETKAPVMITVPADRAGVQQLDTMTCPPTGQVYSSSTR